MTTVGYGEIYPKTAEGRVAAAVLLVLGIALYSAIIASITSYFMGHDSHPSEGLVPHLERLTRLHHEGNLSDAEFDAAKRQLLRSGEVA